MPFIGGMQIRLPNGLTNNNIDVMHAHGVKEVRITQDLQTMAPVSGPVTNWMFETQVDYALSLGMRVNLCITYCPSWIQSYHKIPQNSTQRGQWKTLAAAIVTHYAARCGPHSDPDITFSIWNEPNHGPFNENPSMATLRPFFHDTIIAMRTVKPDAFILVGGAASAGSHTLAWRAKWDTGVTPVTQVPGDYGSGGNYNGSISIATFSDSLYSEPGTPEDGTGVQAGTLADGATKAWVSGFEHHVYPGWVNPLALQRDLMFENPLRHIWDPIPGIGDPAIFTTVQPDGPKAGQTQGFNFWDHIWGTREPGHTKKIFNSEGGWSATPAGQGGLLTLETARDFMYYGLAFWLHHTELGHADVFNLFELFDNAAYGTGNTSEDYLGIFPVSSFLPKPAMAVWDAFTMPVPDVPPPVPEDPPPDPGEIAGYLDWDLGPLAGQPDWDDPLTDWDQAEVEPPVEPPIDPEPEPPGPVGPESTINQFRYFGVGLLDPSKPLIELPLMNVSFSDEYKSIADAKGTMVLGDERLEKLDIIGNTTPERTALFIEFNGSLVWGGIIWARPYDSESKKIEVRAETFGSFYEKLLIGPPGLNLTQIEQKEIARRIVAFVRNKHPNADIQTIVTGLNPPSPRLRDRVYNGYEYKDAMEAIHQLSEVIDGFDYHFDVRYGPANQFQHLLTLSYPSRGVGIKNTQLVLDFPGNIIKYSFDDDQSDKALHTTALGAGEGNKMLVADAENQDFINAGYPYTETTYSYKDIINLAPLQGHANKDIVYLNDRFNGMKVRVPIVGNPQFGTYIIGDDALIRIQDERFPNGVTGVPTQAGVLRLVGWDVKPDDGYVDLTLASKVER